MKVYDKLERLRGVDPELIATMLLGCHLWVRSSHPDSFVRFTEGLRSPDRQAQLVKDGLSTTLHSYHLNGRAVDVALFPLGELTWDLDYYRDFADHVFQAANEFSTAITWGGHWAELIDGVHFQIEKFGQPRLIS